MKVLILNQAFYPDVVATSQHAGDLARALEERGHAVTVVSSERAYDNPQRKFFKRETWNGVDIRRVACTAFGKGAKWRRALDFGSFIVSCCARLLFTRGQDVVIALTSPPLISFIGALFTVLKGGRLVFWVMDLNPDEAIAAGWLSDCSPLAGVLKRMLQFSLRKASLVVVLDRFMRRRIEEKGTAREKIFVMPPWSHDDVIRFDPDGRDSFRAEHRLAGKFVVMYSGNHSPCHPLDPLLMASEKLESDDRIRFCFVGGGSEFAKVKRFASEKRLQNIVCLPYLPFSKLAGSLSAADMHVVVMGEPFRGIVHPCKIYNVLSIGMPFLYIGPRECHVTDILQDCPELRAYSAMPGEVDRIVAHIRQAYEAASSPLAMNEDIRKRFGKESLLPRLITEIERLADVRQPRRSIEANELSGL
jgi:glycosyltransferase involved in cell wall biosynthesis